MCFFLHFSHYKSMRAIDRQDMANFHPRGMIGRICVGNHLPLLHTKYYITVSCWPTGFRQEDFKAVSHYKSISSLMLSWQPEFF